MKCPKCHYISFDTPERCRHCGYEFALLEAAERPVDAPLRDPSASDGPMPDLALRDEQAWQGEARARGGVELPLFNEPVPGLDDTPLISTPSPPRAPLAVRRATPDPTRLPRPVRQRTPRALQSARPAPPTPAPPSPEVVPGLLDEAESFRPEDEPPERVAAPPRVERDADVNPADLAPAGARLGALLVDTALLALIDVSVVYFTLAVVGFAWARLPELPLLPLVAFCLMLDAGYFVLLVGASGQTLGKMLTGIRVVGADLSRVSVTQAALRASLAVLSIATLGLGYVPALVGRDRRALHDRLSNTRVVRA